MPKTPEPDDFGHLRVRDEDTGHELTVPSAVVAHGRFTVLDEPASNLGGDPLPVKHATPKSLSRSVEPNPNSGQQADPAKENAHG